MDTGLQLLDLALEPIDHRADLVGAGAGLYQRSLNSPGRVAAGGGHRQLQWVRAVHRLEPRLEGGQRSGRVRERQFARGGEVGADRAGVCGAGVTDSRERIVAPRGHHGVLGDKLLGARPRPRERISRVFESPQESSHAADRRLLACGQRLGSPAKLGGAGLGERVARRSGDARAVGVVMRLALDGGELRRRGRLLGLGRGEPVAKLGDPLVQTLDRALRVRSPPAGLLGLLGGPMQLPGAARRGVVLERLAPGVEARSLGTKCLQRLPCVRELGLRARMILVGLAELPAQAVEHGLRLPHGCGAAPGRHPRVRAVRGQVPLGGVARLDHRGELLAVLLERAERLGDISHHRLVERG